MMKYRIMIIFILIGSFSCNEKDTTRRFYSIEWFTYTFNDQVGDSLRMGEAVLVDNFPKEKDAVTSMILSYIDNYGMNIEPTCKSYWLSFYKYTNETEVFLREREREDSFGSKYSLGEEEKYNVGDIMIYLNPHNPHKWIVYVDIWCKSEEDKNYYTSHRTLIDSCATLVNNKLVLSKPIGKLN